MAMILSSKMMTYLLQMIQNHFSQKVIAHWPFRCCQSLILMIHVSSAIVTVYGNCSPATSEAGLLPSQSEMENLGLGQ